MFLYVFGVADANFDVSFCIASMVLKYLQQIEVCNLPNNITTLALSDIYINFNLVLFHLRHFLLFLSLSRWC